MTDPHETRVYVAPPPPSIAPEASSDPVETPAEEAAPATAPVDVPDPALAASETTAAPATDGTLAAGASEETPLDQTTSELPGSGEVAGALPETPPAQVVTTEVVTAPATEAPVEVAPLPEGVDAAGADTPSPPAAELESAPG
jgi:hypothetical protein